jgi:hypothetical protein
MPFLKRAGNRVAFQQGALVGALSYFLMVPLASHSVPQSKI